MSPQEADAPVEEDNLLSWRNESPSSETQEEKTLVEPELPMELLPTANSSAELWPAPPRHHKKSAKRSSKSKTGKSKHKSKHSTDPRPTSETNAIKAPLPVKVKEVKVQPEKPAIKLCIRLGPSDSPGSSLAKKASHSHKRRRHEAAENLSDDEAAKKKRKKKKKKKEGGRHESDDIQVCWSVV